MSRAIHATDSDCLVVNMLIQQIHWKGQVQEVRTQWALGFLHTLISHGHHDAHTAASASRMQEVLHTHGLTRALRPVEWSRIVHGLSNALNALDPSGILSSRLQHWPRGKTVGPWWFQVDKGLTVRCVEPRLALPQSLGPDVLGTLASATLSMSVDPLGHSALTLTRRFKEAMEAHWKALPAYAAELLDDHKAWAGESDALRALRRLRRAEILYGHGELATAKRLIEQLDSELMQPDVRALISPHLEVLRLRVRYSSDPVAQHVQVGRAARRALSPRVLIPGSRLDAAVMAEHFHLLLLCERRWLEQHPIRDARDPHRIAMLHSAHSAIFLYLLARNLERAQHACANLAYAHQKLAAQRPDDHVALAIGWHELSFGMHTSFSGAEGSAWEYIYVGELWLEQPEARRIWSKLNHDGIWCDTTPAQESFYSMACRIADQLNDPRQQAYTRLNRYRYALQQRDLELAAEAMASLDSHLNRHPHIMKLLVDEGYPLPSGLVGTAPAV